MKKYIFFTCDIHPMGGVQAYLTKKIQYLKNNGWEVSIFYNGYPEKHFAIRDLAMYNNGGTILFYYPPYEFSKPIIWRMIEYISKEAHINIQDEIIIETHSITQAMWGELVADKYNAKNLCFILDENFNNKYYRDNLDFLKFKYERRELAGISDRSLKMMFSGYMEVPVSNRYALNAAQADVVENIDFDTENLGDFDYIISYLGRDKDYVPNIFDGIHKFAEKYSDKKICLILIGDISLERYRLFEKVSNVEVKALGVHFPIPQKIFKLTDAMIAGSGCACVSIEQGVPTIIPDAKDYKCNGILGYTTDNWLFVDRKKVSAYKYEDVLEDILISKKYLQLEYHKPKIDSSDSEYEKHFDFINKSVSEKKYFNVIDTDKEKNKFCMQRRIRNMLFGIFGIKFATVVHLNVYMKLLKKQEGNKYGK